MMKDLFRDYGFPGRSVLPCSALPKDASGFAELDARVKEADEMGLDRQDQFRIFWVDFQKESKWTRYYKDGAWHYFGSDFWKKEFCRRLRLLRDHMLELGFGYSNWVINTIDEPQGDPTKEGTKAWYAIEGAKIIRAVDPNIRLWVNTTNCGPGPFRNLDDGYQQYYLDWYDVICPNYGRIIPYPKICKLYRESGKEIWTYEVRSKGAMPDTLRAAFWVNAREGFRGPAIIYDLYRNAGDGYDSYDGGESSVDYSLVYRDARTKRFSVSRRMEAWYEGLVDMRLINLAERLARTSAEKMKVKEIVLLGADRKRDFRTLRKGLLKLCKTLKSRRDGERKGEQK